VLDGPIRSSNGGRGRSSVAVRFRDHARDAARSSARCQTIGHDSPIPSPVRHHRWPNKTRRLGSGIHTCLGRASRLEAQEAFAYLSRKRSLQSRSHARISVRSPTWLSQGPRWRLTLRVHSERGWSRRIVNGIRTMCW